MADFTDDAKHGIAMKLGEELGVNSSDVTVTVEAASVKIVCTVKFGSRQQATAGAATLNSTLGSKESASALLNNVPGLEDVQVEQDPTLKEVEEENKTAARFRNSVTTEMMVVASVACFLVAVMVTAILMWYRNKKQMEKMQKGKKGWKMLSQLHEENMQLKNALIGMGVDPDKLAQSSGGGFAALALKAKAMTKTEEIVKADEEEKKEEAEGVIHVEAVRFFSSDSCEQSSSTREQPSSSAEKATHRHTDVRIEKL